MVIASTSLERRADGHTSVNSTPAEGPDRAPIPAAVRSECCLMAKSGRAPRRQFAALPWRHTATGPEVLLTTSRETRRLVIPKGWGKKGESGPFAAAREALEETGVAGAVDPTAIGEYRYGKIMKSGRARKLRVTVYALEVLFEHDDWPEKSVREKRWVALQAVASLVEDPELRSLIEGFAAAQLTHIRSESAE